MHVIQIIIIENIHSSIGLCKNFIIGKVSILIFACFEYNPHTAIAATNTCECHASFSLFLVTNPFFLATSHNLVKQSLQPFEMPLHPLHMALHSH